MKLAFLPALLWIGTAAAADATAPPSGPGLWPATLAMLAVALLAAGGTWLVARVSRQRFANSPLLRVIAAVHVGPRERVVIVEAGESWLVLGVAPGRVNAIHTLAREASAPLEPQRPFAEWLKKVTEKHATR